jgi:hypothetical protein
MASDDNEVEGKDGKLSRSGAGIAVVAVFFLIFTPGSILLRHWMRHWSDTANAIALSVIVVPLAMLTLWSWLREPSKKKRRRRGPLSWAILNEQWRQLMLALILVSISVLALALSAAGIWVGLRIPFVAALIVELSPGVGLFLIVVFSTAVTFSIAALSGTRLIKFITGRSPMGLRCGCRLK